MIGGFYWLFLWNFKEIKHQPFPMAQPYFSNNEIQFLSHEVCRPKGWGEFRIVTLLMNMPIISSGKGQNLAPQCQRRHFSAAGKTDRRDSIKEKAFERNEERRGGREREGKKEGARKTWGFPLLQKSFLAPPVKVPPGYSLRNSKGTSRQNARNSAMMFAVHAARKGCRMPRCPSVVPRVYTAKYRNVHSSATVTAI